MKVEQTHPTIQNRPYDIGLGNGPGPEKFGCDKEKVTVPWLVFVSAINWGPDSSYYQVPSIFVVNNASSLSFRISSSYSSTCFRSILLSVIASQLFQES